MSQKKNIDEVFREGISGYTVQPSEQVWQNIDSRYPYAGRRGRWIRYSLAALLLLTLGFSGWYYNSNDAKVAVESDQQISMDQDLLPISEKETALTGNNSDKPVEENLSMTDNQYSTEEEVAENHHPVGADPGPTEEADGFANTLPGSPDAGYSSEQFEAESNEAYPSIYKDIAFMSSVGITLNSDPDISIEDGEEIKGMELFVKKNKNSHFYTGLTGMAGMMYYPSTKDQFTWSADLVFGLTAKQIYFETGIGYQEMQEEGIYSIEFKSYDSIGYYNEVKSFEVDPLNPDELIYKTEEVSVYDSITHYTHAAPLFRYAYINIPIMVGYKVFQQNKFTVGVETGVMFSMMVSKEIPTVDFSYPEYSLVKTINETPDRLETNFRWQVAVRLDYRFARSMSFAIKPVFNKYLNPVYDTQNGYSNVKPYSMGLQFGIYYGF